MKKVAKWNHPNVLVLPWLYGFLTVVLGCLFYPEYRGLYLKSFLIALPYLFYVKNSFKKNFQDYVLLSTGTKEEKQKSIHKLKEVLIVGGIIVLMDTLMKWAVIWTILAGSIIWFNEYKQRYAYIVKSVTGQELDNKKLTREIAIGCISFLIVIFLLGYLVKVFNLEWK